MNRQISRIEDLDHKETARLVLDMIHRIIIHHVLWLTEVRHQMGESKALDTLSEAFPKSYAIQMKRLAKTLGFEMAGDIPVPLLNMPKEKLKQLLESIAANWLANDGVWFQAVEFTSGMNDAKRCNDSCWAHFSPFEAQSIKKFLGLEESPGLEGLKKALRFRLYALINEYSMREEASGALVFQMDECRVQTARKRKGLDDYPCKSVGLVEYPYFARSIDSRIQTECIGCPPDNHPDEWYCSWRFTL